MFTDVNVLSFLRGEQRNVSLLNLFEITFRFILSGVYVGKQAQSNQQ